MLKSLKISFIYIGSIIGAGFASGREIIVFFYDSSFLSLVLTAILLGLMCVIFIIAKKNSISNTIFNLLIFISMTFTFIMMVSASASLFDEIFNAPYISIILAIIISFISMLKINELKIINFIMIPIIVTMLIYLSKDIQFKDGTSIAYLNSFKYVGMNTLLGGVILDKDEKNLNLKEIILIFFSVTICFIVFFFCVFKIAYLYPQEELPILTYASQRRFKYIAGFIIYVAIFTTHLSSSYMLCDQITSILNKKYYSIIYMVLLSLLSYNISYKISSQIVYPILGYMGLVYILFILISLIIKRIFKFNKVVYTFNCKIHNCCHKA